MNIFNNVLIQTRAISFKNQIYSTHQRNYLCGILLVYKWISLKTWKHADHVKWQGDISLIIAHCWTWNVTSKIYLYHSTFNAYSHWDTVHGIFPTKSLLKLPDIITIIWLLSNTVISKLDAYFATRQCLHLADFLRITLGAFSS